MLSIKNLYSCSTRRMVDSKLGVKPVINSSRCFCTKSNSSDILPTDQSTFNDTENSLKFKGFIKLDDETFINLNKIVSIEYTSAYKSVRICTSGGMMRLTENLHPKALNTIKNYFN